MRAITEDSDCEDRFGQADVDPLVRGRACPFPSVNQNEDIGVKESSGRVDAEAPRPLEVQR